MNIAITALLIVIGLINFVPLAGILGLKSLESVYSVSITSDDLLILMQHRALLFGLLGGLVLYSAFVPFYQTIAIVMAGISMIGFAVLLHMAGSTNPAMLKVLYIDYFGILLWLIVVVLKLGFKA